MRGQKVVRLRCEEKKLGAGQAGRRGLREAYEGGFLGLFAGVMWDAALGRVIECGLKANAHNCAALNA